jgi:DNA-binding transcriptional LysR family regulator
MDIELLRGFVALAIKRNFSIAAKALYVSQPTLSRRIAALEKELGVKLINRTVPLTLTKVGEGLLASAEESVNVYDAFRARADELRRNDSRVLVLQDRSYSGPMYDAITSCERDFVKAHPKTTFEHIECPSGKSIWSLVEDGDLDICFVETYGSVGSHRVPEKHEGIGCAEMAVAPVHPCFVWSKDNPLIITPPPPPIQ